jgi:hypothetical protein
MPLREMLSDLHDATLMNLAFAWESAKLRLEFRTGVDAILIIEAEGVSDLRCPRNSPWGPSSSVNTVSVEALSEECQLLAVEMQSGDVVEIRCQKIHSDQPS